MAEDPLLALFYTIEGDETPSISTLGRAVERYSVTGVRESYKLIIQWLKALKLIEGSIVAIDSSKIYAEGQEGTAEVYDYHKKSLSEKYRHVGIKVLLNRIVILGNSTKVFCGDEIIEMYIGAFWFLSQDESINPC